MAARRATTSGCLAGCRRRRSLYFRLRAGRKRVQLGEEMERAVLRSCRLGLKEPNHGMTESPTLAASAVRRPLIPSPGQRAIRPGADLCDLRFVERQLFPPTELEHAVDEALSERLRIVGAFAERMAPEHDAFEDEAHVSATDGMPRLATLVADPLACLGKLERLGLEVC